MSGSAQFGNVGIIPSLAVFRGISASGFPPVVFLQGTTTPLDGGQGFYEVNLTDKTTADNGTTTIVDTAGYRWFLVTDVTKSQILASLGVVYLDAITAISANIVAAGTTDLSNATATGDLITITGNTTITSFGIAPAGAERTLIFSGAPLLTYNATSLILPGAANKQVVAGDIAIFRSLGSGNWTCIAYTPGNTVPGVVPISDGGTGKTTSVAAFNALQAKGADIVAASTTDLSTATGPFVNITGNTTITSFGTVSAGVRIQLRFTGTPLLTYNATSLILPTSANIQAAAGDTAIMESLGSGNWRCLQYQLQSGLILTTLSLGLGGTGQTTAPGAFDAVGGHTGLRILFKLIGGDTNSTGDQLMTQVGSFSTWMAGPNGNVRVVNSSGDCHLMVGGIYSAASKGGTAVVAAASTWTGITSAGYGASNSQPAPALGVLSFTTLYVSLSTPSGNAGVTADWYILGVPLS